MRCRITALPFFMADTIEEQILETALSPAEVAVDDQRVKGQPLADLIKAADRAKAETATSRNHVGIRLCRLEAPGAG